MPKGAGPEVGAGGLFAEPKALPGALLIAKRPPDPAGLADVLSGASAYVLPPKAEAGFSAAALVPDPKANPEPPGLPAPNILGPVC